MYFDGELISKLNEEYQLLLSATYSNLSEGDIFILLRENLSDSVKTVDKRTSNKIDAKTKGTVDALKKLTIGSTQEEIIYNRKKVSTLVKKAATIGTAAAINPAIAVLGTFSYAIAKKKLKKSEQEKILFELKQELEIVEEKIRDADNNNEKEKKYELMRLRMEINKSIERIRRGY